MGGYAQVVKSCMDSLRHALLCKRPDAKCSNAPCRPCAMHCHAGIAVAALPAAADPASARAARDRRPPGAADPPLGAADPPPGAVDPQLGAAAHLPVEAGAGSNTVMENKLTGWNQPAGALPLITCTHVH